MEQKAVSITVSGSLSEIETICSRIAKQSALPTKSKNQDDEDEDSGEEPVRKRRASVESEKKPARKRRSSVDPGDEEPQRNTKKKQADDEDEGDGDDMPTLEQIKKLFAIKQDEVSESEMDKLFGKFEIEKISQLEKPDFKKFYDRLKNL